MPLLSATLIERTAIVTIAAQREFSCDQPSPQFAHPLVFSQEIFSTTSSRMHHIHEITDASSFLRNGIQETPGLTMVDRSALSTVAFTISEHPSLIHELGACLRDEGWPLRILNNPPALQVCLTDPIAVRVHELMKKIREKFFLIIHSHKLGSSTPQLSSNHVLHPHPVRLKAVGYEGAMLAHSTAPIFKQYPESSLLMLFGNVCGR